MTKKIQITMKILTTKKILSAYLGIVPGHIIPAQIIHQNEENVGRRGCSRQLHQQAEYYKKKI